MRAWWRCANRILIGISLHMGDSYLANEVFYFFCFWFGGSWRLGHNRDFIILKRRENWVEIAM